MRKKMGTGFLAAIVLALSLPALAYAQEGKTLTPVDVFETQGYVDEALLAELSSQRDFSDPEVIVDPYQASPLTAVILFHTEEEIGGTITVKGKQEKDNVYGSFDPATDHIVPVYGLYNGEETQVELSLSDGRSTTLSVETEKQSLDFGTFEAQMLDESVYDYGCLTFIYPFGGTIYAVDSEGDIRWCYSGGGSMGIHPLRNGHLLVPMAFTLKTTYYKEGLQEIDLNGRVYAQYVIPGGQHHDFQELPNGNLLVASDAPDLSTIEDFVVEVDRETGEVVWSLDMKELLPVGTGQSASMDTDGSEESDWCHNNSLWYDAANDLVLLSCRHLDAIVAVHKEDKTLAWILGDPTGWDGVDESLFFTPAGEDFEWFYAQHEVTMLDNGDVMLFDNGTAKVKRIQGEERVSGSDVYSRAVVYRLDTENMTAEQVFSYGKDRGDAWYSDWVSGVESLDGTDELLWITAGSHLYSPEEDRHDFYPSDMMKPGLLKSTHMDLVADGKLAYELTISGESFLSLAFRSARISPYSPGMTLDLTREPVILGSLGETPYVEVTEPRKGQELPASANLSFTADSVKLSISGTYETEKKAEELGDFCLVLQSEKEARQYALTALPTEGEEGTSCAISGWVSMELPKDTYQVFIMLDGQVFDTLWRIEA